MGLSRRAYARHREELRLPGASLAAVQRALARDRIHLEPDGTIDPDRADREWAANTDLSEAPASVVAAHAATRHADIGGVSGPLAADAQEPREGMTLPEANAIKAVWQAKTARLEYLEAAKELIPAAEVSGRLTDVFRKCRTKLLGIPARARQAMPELTPGQVGRLENLIREAIEDLAAGGAT